MIDALSLINAEIDLAQKQLDGIRAHLRELQAGDLDELITAEELARRIGVKPDTCYDKARMKKWPSYKDGQIVRFSFREVKEVMRR